MSPNKRRNFSGVFRPQERGRGGWQLNRTAPPAHVFVRDAEAGAAKAFGMPIVDLGIEWHGEGVLLTFMCGNRVSTVAAKDVIVHEPLGSLYDSLPLASVDADARRFWHRVFRLVRLPGGRYFLKLLIRPRKR